MVTTELCDGEDKAGLIRFRPVVNVEDVGVLTVLGAFMLLQSGFRPGEIQLY